MQEFIETVGDDQFYYGLYLVSAGGAAGNGIQSVTDIKLNDQPIGNFAEATSEVRLGTATQTKIPWFADTRVTRAHGITLDTDGTSSIFTMPAGTTAQALIANLRFPSGLFTLDANGNLKSNVVNVTIEYRVFGAVPWTLLITTDIREAKRNTFTRPFRVDNLTVARYEVRVTRNSTGDRTASSQYSMIFDTIDTILYGNTSFPKFAMLGIRVKATDQLSGSAPRVTCLVEGRKVRTRSGGAWTAETYTRNPVWHTVDAMTDTQYGGGAYIDDAKLDIPSLEAAAAVADALVDDLAAGTEARYMNDAVFDVQVGLYDALDVMLRSFRATLIDAGNTYRMFVDQARSTSQLFGNHNILRGTFRNGFVSLKEEFTQVELVCFDQASDYTRETVRFPTTASPLKRKQVELPTITRLSQALREAKYHMNAISALSRWAQFDCFLEGLAAEVGDVVDVSHDVPQWGYPGRILASVLVSGTTYDLTVDRDDLPTPTDHRMLVRHETDLIETGTVVSLTGRVVRASGLSRLPKARDSGYAYGPANQTSKLYQVQAATLTPAFDRRLFLVEYDAAIYDATGLVLPARSPSQLPNLQAPPGSVTNLTLAEQLLLNEQGIYVSRMQMTWNNPVWATGQGLFDHCEVWLSRDGGLSYAPIGEARESPFVTQTLPISVTYWIKVVTVSTNIVKQTLAAAATASLALLGENANPSTVTGLANTFIGRTVRLTWNAVVDADIDYYEIRLNDGTWGTADANLVGRTKSNEFIWPDRTARSYTVYVRARDMGGRYSSASASTSPSNTAPTAVAAPTVSAYFQVMEVSWPASAETDVIGYDLHASQTTGFTPGAGTRLARIDGRLSQYYLFRADAPSQTWYFKVAPEDELSLLLGDQNYSAQGSASSGQVVTADLIDAIINTAKLGTGVVTNDKIAARTILMDRLIVANFSNLLEEPGFEDSGAAWMLPTGGLIVGGTDPRNGNGTLRITALNGTDRKAETKQDVFVLPGDKFYMSVWARCSDATGGVVVIGIDFYDKTGAFLSSVKIADTVTVPITWTEYTGTVTVPASAVKGKIICLVQLTSTTGRNLFFDDLLFRRLIGSSFIEDLAVTNAKIASLVADKISGGDITAATIGIGRTTDPAILIKGTTREILIRDSGGTTRIRIGTPTVT